MAADRVKTFRRDRRHRQTRGIFR